MAIDFGNVLKVSTRVHSWGSGGCQGRANRFARQGPAQGSRQWLCRQHKIRAEKSVRCSDDQLWQAIGLMRLKRRTVTYAWAKA